MNNHALLSLYKEEKADMEFPSSPFMPFKEWKVDYLADWAENHMKTDTDEALEEAYAELRKKAPIIKPKKKKAKAKTVTKIVKPKVKKHSKKDDAIAVYKSMMVGDTHPARKDVIQAFVDKIGMTVAGSSTYHFNVRKEFLEGKHKI